MATSLEPDRPTRRVFPLGGGDDHDWDEPFGDLQGFRSKPGPGNDGDPGKRPGQYVQNALLCDFYGAFRDSYGQGRFPDLLDALHGLDPEVCGEAKLENHHLHRMRLDHTQLPDICVFFRSPPA